MNQNAIHTRKPKAFFVAVLALFWPFMPLLFLTFLINEVFAAKLIWYIVFPICSVICYFFSYIKHRCTEYSFYENYLECKKSFINLKQETIQYKSIIDVQREANLLQRLFFVSTLQIKTANSTLKIISIKNAREVYDFIKRETQKKYHSKEKESV